MQWIDILIILAVGGFTITGFLNGFIREITNIVGLVAAVVIAAHSHAELAPLLRFLGDGPAPFAAFVLIFIAVVLMAGYLGALLEQAANLMMLGALDNFAGAALGMVKGMLFTLIALIVTVHFPVFGLDSAVISSALGRVILNQAPFLLTLLPAEFEGIRRLVA